MKKTNPSTLRAKSSRNKLIKSGGERFEVRLAPTAAANRQQVMSKRKIDSKTQLMDTLLKEEAARLSQSVLVVNQSDTL